jgi:hypothetical protein
VALTEPCPAPARLTWSPCPGRSVPPLGAGGACRLPAGDCGLRFCLCRGCAQTLFPSRAPMQLSLLSRARLRSKRFVLRTAVVLRRFVDRFVLVPAVKRVLSDFLPQLRGAAHLDLDRAAAARSADVEPAPRGRMPAFCNGLHHTYAHRSMAEFDDATIAPMMGCPDALSYYSEASASRGGIAIVESMAESAPSRECPAETSVRPFWILVRQSSAMCASPSCLSRRTTIQSALAFDTTAFTDAASQAPILLAITKEGAHSMTWPEGWRLERSWLCALLVEWVHAVDATCNTKRGAGPGGTSSGKPLERDSN